MSAENKRIVERLFEEIEDGKFAVGEEILSDCLVFHRLSTGEDENLNDLQQRFASLRDVSTVKSLITIPETAFPAFWAVSNLLTSLKITSLSSSLCDATTGPKTTVALAISAGVVPVGKSILSPFAFK